MDENQKYRGFLGRIYAVGPITVMELRGELDIFAAWTLSDRLDDLTGTGRADLVLDLCAVTFIDCAGLSLLCRARHRTQALGGRLRLTGVTPGDSVTRLLRLTGLTGAFEIVTGDHAMSAGTTWDTPDHDACADAHERLLALQR